MRSAKLAAVSGGLLIAATLAAASVHAAPTDATFTVTAGTLAVTTPASANIGSGAPGAVVDGLLGAVTVTDGRASANASWTATVTSTNSTTGTGTLTPGQATAANKAPLNTTTPLTAFTHTGRTGNNTAVWNPTISVRVPLDSQAGTYTGTVTHSVA
jgi:hypothetical protein